MSHWEAREVPSLPIQKNILLDAFQTNVCLNNLRFLWNHPSVSILYHTTPCLFTAVVNYNSITLLSTEGKRRKWYLDEWLLHSYITLAFLRGYLEASLKVYHYSPLGQVMKVMVPEFCPELRRLLIQHNLRNNKLPDNLISYSDNCICKKKQKKSKTLNIPFVTCGRSLWFVCLKIARSWEHIFSTVLFVVSVNSGLLHAWYTGQPQAELKGRKCLKREREKKSEAGEMAHDFRGLTVLAEDPSHMATVPGKPVPSYELCGHQAWTWHTDRHKFRQNTHTHIYLLLCPTTGSNFFDR